MVGLLDAARSQELALDDGFPRRESVEEEARLAPAGTPTTAGGDRTATRSGRRSRGGKRSRGGNGEVETLRSRVADLERQIEDARIARGRLIEALEVVPEALVLFDAEDRFVFWNKRYAELYIRPGDDVNVGMRFEDLLRAGLRRGEYVDAIGREEAWLEARLARHAMQTNSHEQHTADGRWVRVHEQRTMEGGSIGLRTDITDLKRRESSVRLLFDANPVAMVVYDRASLAILAANDQAIATYGYDRDLLLGQTIDRLGPGLDRAMEPGPPAADPDAVHRHQRADGAPLLVRWRTTGIHYEGRDAALCSIVDCTTICRVEDELFRTQALLHSVIENIPLTVFAKDLADDGRYVVFNRAAERLTGVARAEVIGRRDHDVFEPTASARYRLQDREIAETGAEMSYEEECLWGHALKRVQTRKVPIPARPGEATRYILAIQEDVTERRLIEQTMMHMAHHDPLTNLANRTLFRQRLQAAAAQQADSGEGYAVLLIDLDRFKQVNDTLGHQAGDALLVKVAERLRLAAGRTDCLARLGGDEFAVLQSPAASLSEAIRLARRIIELVGAAQDIDPHTVNVSASIGVAFASAGETDIDTVLRNADLALYEAKTSGRSKMCVFEERLGASAVAHRALEQDLRRAVETGAFDLHYQPFYSLRERAICGFEALLRWRHPDRGYVPPLEFLPLAEELGLIEKLGAWVLRRACRDAASWPDHLRVAVNLSATQIQAGGVSHAVFDALRRSGLSPARLELEITESVLLVANEECLTTLHNLREAGISISLDDFGTGYSSLSYLHNLPFDRIKIDRSFVKDIGHAPGCLAIVRAVMGLSSSLKVATTAEGVETLDQLSRVAAEGCDEVQGFLVSAAVPAAEVARLLAAAPSFPLQPSSRQGSAGQHGKPEGLVSQFGRHASR